MLLNLGVVAAVAWFAFNPRVIEDRWIAWTFEASPEIEQYATDTTMTEHARILFLASKPVVLDDEAFDSKCSTTEQEFGVLGCYVSPQDVIYLYDVTDARLAGLEEVVAAHEMLHAAWDRLGADERARLEALLEREVDRLSGDGDLAERLAAYARTEPGERANELHSILATEYRDLAPELESYYAQYFTDRGAVVDLHEQSIAVFEAQQAQIADLTERLQSLGAEIDAAYAAYTAGYDVLGNDIDAFNAKADAGAFASQAQFTRERNALLARQAALDASYQEIVAKNTTYDDLLAQLDAIGAEVDELNASINIEPRSEPAP